MALELEGRIAQKMTVQSGTSARGAWSKQEFIFEFQEGNYPTTVLMHVWGDDKVKVSFNLGSREYNGRWYTDVRVWRMEPAQAAGGYDYAQSAASYSAPTGVPVSPSVPMPNADDMSEPADDDLPF